MRFLSWMLTLSVLAGASAATAQSAGEADEGESRTAEAAEEGVVAADQELEVAQRARRLFLDGIEAFRARDFRAAIERFSLAASLVPSADLQYNIARAHEELGNYEEAVSHYRAYLRDRVDPPDRGRVEAHVAALNELAANQGGATVAATTGTLTLSANLDGAAVTLDDEPTEPTPWVGARSVNPGRHALEVESEGFVPFRANVSVAGGLRTAAYVDLVPETRFRAIRADPVFAWIAWGIGVAGLGVTVGLGVEALSRQSASLVEARRWAAFSDGALAASLGFGVLGAVLWFIESRSVGTEQVRAEGSGGGIRLRGAEDAMTPAPDTPTQESESSVEPAEAAGASGG